MPCFVSVFPIPVSYLRSCIVHINDFLDNNSFPLPFLLGEYADTYPQEFALAIDHTWMPYWKSRTSKHSYSFKHTVVERSSLSDYSCFRDSYLSKGRIKECNFMDQGIRKDTEHRTLTWRTGPVWPRVPHRQEHLQDDVYKWREEEVPQQIARTGWNRWAGAADIGICFTNGSQLALWCLSLDYSLTGQDVW